MQKSTEHLIVDNSQMSLYVAIPDGDGPFPALVVGMHAGGVDDFIKGMCDRFAEAGYVAAAPDLYHRKGPDDDRSPRALIDNEMIADVEATVAFLKDHASVDSDRLGVTGFCMGGRVAYLMASAVPVWKAAVAYYGGNTKMALGEGASPFDRTTDIMRPPMFHAGGQDKNPSPDDVRDLDAELTRHGKPHEFHTYPDAGHAFMDFTGQRHHPQAAEESWPRSIGFFSRHMKT